MSCSPGTKSVVYEYLVWNRVVIVILSLEFIVIDVWPIVHAAVVLDI